MIRTRRFDDVRDAEGEPCQVLLTEYPPNEEAPAGWATVAIRRDASMTWGIPADCVVDEVTPVRRAVDDNSYARYLDEATRHLEGR
jgi:hypothetical protein